MKAIRVQYTVREDFVEENKANVRAVMEDLRDNPIEGMSYSTFYLGEGNFMHVNVSRDEETTSKLGQREKFKAFQQALKASGPLSPPKAEQLELVGSSRDLV